MSTRIGRVTTLAQALDNARAQGLARLDAQVLLAHVTGLSRSGVLANDRQELDPVQEATWNRLLARRAAGEPLAYLTGEREFHGLGLKVTPAVLIPRPDTELLVDWAIDRIDAHQSALPASITHVLDLGTGSGAIALAVKQARPGCEVTGTDASPAALEVADANARRLNLIVRWRVGDWLDAVEDETFDLVLSNPPYIADDDPHLEPLRHEPMQALVAGPLGLDALKCIIARTVPRLRPGGWLLLEHGHEQAPAVQALLEAAGYVDICTRKDLAGHPRCTGARWSRSRC
jgi:release factor glutamine methyltransferase